MLEIVGAVGVANDEVALDGLDAVLAGDPLVGRMTAEATVEDDAKEPLDEKVLDQRLLNRGFQKVWVDRLVASVEETNESVYLWFALPLPLSQLRQPLADTGRSFVEMSDRLFPGGTLLGVVGEKDPQRFYRFRRFRQVPV